MPDISENIYEVNALPSIELPVRYSAILPATLKKIKSYENFASITVTK